MESDRGKDSQVKTPWEKEEREERERRRKERRKRKRRGGKDMYDKRKFQ